jgi:uncharacterized membrane protein YeaQ/YmgE (transglycosylase-associated protein family)
MSYLLIVIIGAIVGFIAGQYLKGSEHGRGIDALAGALGGCVFIFLSRAVGPAALSTGWFMSTVVTAVGAVVTLFILRQVMIRKTVVAPKPRRRF